MSELSIRGFAEPRRLDGPPAKGCFRVPVLVDVSGGAQACWVGALLGVAAGDCRGDDQRRGECECSGQHRLVCEGTPCHPHILTGASMVASPERGRLERVCGQEQFKRGAGGRSV